MTASKDAAERLLDLLSDRFEAAPGSLRQFMSREAGRELPPVSKWTTTQVMWAYHALCGEMGERFETFLNTPPDAVADPLKNGGAK